MGNLIADKYASWKAECEEYPPVALQQPPFQGGLEVQRLPCKDACEMDWDI